MRRAEAIQEIVFLIALLCSARNDYILRSIAAQLPIAQSETENPSE
jgi:hypothetical protein